MCGIAGIIGPGGRANIGQMTDALRHRGPDGRGIWTSGDDRVSLGHRRLAVIDPNVGAAQPMWSHDGRICLVFNGEIYNFLELRSRLTGLAFKTNSDTEVLVETISRIGIAETLRIINGMFAFAAFDTQRREIHLACDRLGEKPLYYGHVGDDFVFASELKSVRKHPQFAAPINRDALALFLRYNYVPAPHSIYVNIQKLQAAHYLTLSVDKTNALPQAGCYWDLRQVAKAGLQDQLLGSDDQIMDQLEERLSESVGSRMVSDVPLGAFLSGGYDSTLVVAMMQKHSNSPIKTFSIGLNEDGYNEAVYASSVASHLKTDHTELIVNSDDALELIPQLSTIYCEPFADSSQIPTSIVARLARQHVTVALSGDGGDELFGGYNRHFQAGRSWERMRWVPVWMRGLLSHTIRFATAEQWNRMYRGLEKLTASGVSMNRPGEKMHKLAGVMGACSPRDLYHRLCSLIDDPRRYLKSGQEPFDPITATQNHLSIGDFADLMMYLDTMTYLPGDILTKVDRATMAHSLESRVPLLDHRVVEFAWRLPQRFKIRGGEGKWALKQIVHRHVPQALMARPKMGFSIPLDQWLRGPLRPWAEDLLNRDRIESEGFFHAAPVQRLLQRHLSKQEQNEHQLWSLLMFQSWQASIQ